MLTNTERSSASHVFGQGHKNIMKLFDAIDTPKQLYLILENVDGKMLHQVLKEAPNNMLKYREVQQIFK